MGSFRPITGRFNHDCSQPLRARWTLAAPSTMDAAATGCSVLDLFDATSDAAALEAQPEGDAEGPVVPRERGALGHVGDGREERNTRLGKNAAARCEGHVDPWQRAERHRREERGAQRVRRDAHEQQRPPPRAIAEAAPRARAGPLQTEEEAVAERHVRGRLVLRAAARVEQQSGQGDDAQREGEQLHEDEESQAPQADRWRRRVVGRRGLALAHLQGVGCRGDDAWELHAIRSIIVAQRAALRGASVRGPARARWAQQRAAAPPGTHPPGAPERAPPRRAAQ